MLFSIVSSAEGIDTMSKDQVAPSSAKIIARTDFDRFFAALAASGRRVVGPTELDGAVVLAPLAGAAEMPAGRGDEQSGGHYRLTDRNDGALFGYTLSPQSWKRELHPPRAKLFSSRKDGVAVSIEAAGDDYPETVFLGVRPCELAAIALQDKVFDNGDFADSVYNGRRDKSLIVVANCTHAAATCFCLSMGGDPRAEHGFDIALTEILDGTHRFLAVAGSAAGAALLDAAGAKDAADADLRAADAAIQPARDGQSKAMHADHRALLARNIEHPRWEKVAERCLNCANCTMVCPTCFCTTVEDVTSLDGAYAERWRTWDSCFSVDFSYIHGGAIRPSGAARYRQWITHKLTSWHDQFGASGCTGCGRCIAWCPVGIDITEETAAIAADDRGAAAAGNKEG